jgi:hypothetical protein
MTRETKCVGTGSTLYIRDVPRLAASICIVPGYCNHKGGQGTSRVGHDAQAIHAPFELATGATGATRRSKNPGLNGGKPRFPDSEDRLQRSVTLELRAGHEGGWLGVSRRELVF